MRYNLMIRHKSGWKCVYFAYSFEQLYKQNEIVSGPYALMLNMTYTFIAMLLDLHWLNLVSTMDSVDLDAMDWIEGRGHKGNMLV